MLKNLPIKYLLGSPENIENIQNIPVLPTLAPQVIAFLDRLAKIIMEKPENRLYADVISLGFWCRRGNIVKFDALNKANIISTGLGVAFHIAPGNVALNFAYSLALGLLGGNINIVRLPSREFPQVDIICQALAKALEEYEDLLPYINLVRYGHDKHINDYFSALCDIRIIWGGDNTIRELRGSPLKARGREITFADRFSVAIIDGKKYLAARDKAGLAKRFYNDTYLTDQNACTSPKYVLWLNDFDNKAKEEFWQHLYKLVASKYSLKAVQAVDKLVNMYMLASQEKLSLSFGKDNLLKVYRLENLKENSIAFLGNSGYFLEYNSSSLEELRDLAVDERLQTVSYYGLEGEEIRAFINKLPTKGIDRFVPIGESMNFSPYWDGYSLLESLSKKIMII